MIMRDPDRSEAAVRLLDGAIGDLAEPRSQLSRRLEAHLLAAAGLKLSTRPLQVDRLNDVYSSPLGDEPADRLLLANLANWTLIDGRVPGRFADLARHAGASGSPAEVACRVAERALAGGELLREEGSDSQLFYVAVCTLCFGDCLERAEYWLDHAVEDARQRGSVLGYGLAEATQAAVAYRRGDLTQAEAHARAAAAISPEDAAAVLVNILIEQGRLDEADRVLAPFRIPPKPIISCCNQSARPRRGCASPRADSMTPRASSSCARTGSEPGRPRTPPISRGAPTSPAHSSA
jgi:hypothetical protein